MRDEIKAEVERQLRSRDAKRHKRNALIVLVLGLLVGGAVFAQQQGFGGQHQMADLFKVFYSWTPTTVTVNNSRQHIADTYSSTSSTVSVAAGTANYSCNANPATSSPCLANYTHPLELGGYHFVSPQDNASDVYMGCMENKDGGYCLQVLNNYGAPNGGVEVMLLGSKWTGDLEVKNDLLAGGDVYSNSATPHFFCFGGVCIFNGGTGGASPAFLFVSHVTQTSGHLASFYANPAGSPVSTIEYNGEYISQAASGSNAYSAATSGAKWAIGPGVNSTLAEVSNGYLTSPAYIASATPETVASVYVNNVITAGFTYGGGTLPARAMTITDIAWNVRTAGSGGTTNNTFQISDGTNTCNCTMACNQSTGSKIASCANGAGTGCVYAASAALTYAFSALGDCTVPMDVLGNLTVRGKWQ